MQSSGLGSQPGVPQTGWRPEGIEDLGGPDEICEWCPYNKRIRFVHVMSHPDWPDLVRVGKDCGELMGDPYAGKRERAFRANQSIGLRRWPTIPLSTADPGFSLLSGTLAHGRHPPAKTGRCM